MPQPNDQVLLLLGPGVLLAGALLQIAIDRICSARAKGAVAVAT